MARLSRFVPAALLAGLLLAPGAAFADGYYGPSHQNAQVSVGIFINGAPVVGVPVIVHGAPPPYGYRPDYDGWRGREFVWRHDWRQDWRHGQHDDHRFGNDHRSGPGPGQQWYGGAFDHQSHD